MARRRTGRTQSVRARGADAAADPQLADDGEGLAADAPFLRHGSVGRRRCRRGGPHRPCRRRNGAGDLELPDPDLGLRLECLVAADRELPSLMAMAPITKHNRSALLT